MLKASVIGNLGTDPELRYSPSGAPSLRINVASNFRARTPEGEWEDRTEWVRVIVFGQRAESLAQHLKKGMRVFVDGRLEARPWTDRENRVRAGLEISRAMARGTLPGAAGAGSTRPSSRRRRLALHPSSRAVSWRISRSEAPAVTRRATPIMVTHGTLFG